jgi:hypothetical protein
MMDPVSAAIIGAAVTGATGGITNMSKTALMDAYGTLKAALQKHFGPQHAVITAVEAVESKPASDGRQQTLVEEVTEAGADRDAELLRLAEHVRQLLQDHAQDNAMVQQIITGNYNATSVHGDANVTLQLPEEG